MIIHYRFSVKGTLVFDNDLLFEYKSRSYRFETKEGETFLFVATKGDPKTEAPKITYSDSEQRMPHIYIPEAKLFKFIQLEVRCLEGLLSVYGVNEIDVHNPKIFWIAESEDEKKDIHLTEIQRNKDLTPSPKLPPDVIARSIIASHEVYESEVPLIFYRKAFVSFKEGRFRESCVDYFFFLEGLFADGKFKTKEVKNNFKKYDKLQKAISQALQDRSCQEELIETSKTKYENEILGKKAIEISDYLVDHRGKIHHFSKTHKKKWHPGNQDESHFEAVLFKHVCYNIAMAMVLDETFKEDLNLKDIKVYKRE